jgi:hypothetical protein
MLDLERDEVMDGEEEEMAELVTAGELLVAELTADELSAEEKEPVDDEDQLNHRLAWVVSAVYRRLSEGQLSLPCSELTMPATSRHPSGVNQPEERRRHVHVVSQAQA